ncbi:MAG TPA: lytic murein transglycosylase [Candidatus Paceibacterota bacterium]|nr:lytic murein transglycosylase [Candidatus Paceibacterota bacterium]
MRRSFFVAFLLAGVVLGPLALFAQGDLTAARRAELQAQLADLEKQMAQTQNSIDALYSEGESLKRDIAILDGEIKKAKLQVRTTELEIQSLSEGIVIHTRTIGNLTGRIEEDQQSLAQILRKTEEIDEYSLVEAVFSSGDISDFFGDLDDFASIKEAMQVSFEQLRSTREQTAHEKESMEGQRTDQQILRSALILDQQEVEKKEAEKQTLLAETKGQEALYRTLKSVQERTAAEIRAQLFPLRDAQGIQFGDAVTYAKAASAKTGVRPAMILAILSQESDLGKNVGQCLITDITTGDGKGKNTGTPFPGTMKAPRDTVPFERITKALGRDWSTTVVSCPQPGGYGGAMGPTQFIPSTWESYESRLKSALGVSATDPWSASHAIMATGLYLADVGATGGSYTAEHTAAARYYAGGNWATSGQNYANSVMAKAAAFQSDIDFLNNN